MCRWMGWFGQPMILEELLFKPEHSLVVQSLHSQLGVETTNGDGFGIGWYGAGTDAGIYRSVAPAWNDANLRAMAGAIASPLFLAHVRASTGTPVQETNCHPFSHGRWIMVHNGSINDWHELRRDLMLAVDPTLFPHIEGTTDSEVLFHLAQTFGLEQDPLGALERAVGFVEATSAEHGVEPAVQASIGLSDGERLWAVRYATQGTPRSLFVSEDVQSVQRLYPDRPNLQRLRADDRIVVSEPLVDLPGAWHEVPPSTALVIGPDGALDRRPFRPRRAPSRWPRQRGARMPSPPERHAGPARPEWAAWNPDGALRPWTVGLEEEVMLLDPRDWTLANRIEDVLLALPGGLVRNVSAETHACALSCAPARTAPRRPRPRSWRPCARPGRDAARAPRASRRGGRHPPVRRMARRRRLVRCAPSARPFLDAGPRAPGADVRAARPRRRAARPGRDARARRPPGRPSGAARPGGQLPLLAGQGHRVRRGADPHLLHVPAVGIPRRFGSYGGVRDGRRAGALRRGARLDLRVVDVRLQPRLGTVEVRVMDAQTRCEDAATLAALVQCLVRGTPRTSCRAPKRASCWTRTASSPRGTGMRAEPIDPGRARGAATGLARRPARGCAPVARRLAAPTPCRTRRGSPTGPATPASGAGGGRDAP